MQDDSQLKKTLLAIQSEQKLDELVHFKDDSKWEALADDDLTLLANLFLKKGSLDYNKHPEETFEAFHTALKITRYSPDTYLKIAKAWGHLSVWDQAQASINEGLKKDPFFVEGWIEKATLLLHQGSQERKEDLLMEAADLFQKSEQILSPLPAETYYRWGKAYLLLARLSQEPCDFTAAIDKFKQSEQLGFFDKNLYFDHSLALADISSYLGRIEFIHESLMYLLKAVEVDPHFYEGWLHLGGTYKFLYEQGENDEYYERAESAFITTARINSNTKFLWLTWGQMLLTEGKIKRNGDIINQALEKFERADALFPGDRDIECFMADSLMILGLMEDRYELIKEAKTMIEEVLETKPEDPTILFLYATCLLHIGKYFADEKLIRQSFVHYEKACNLNPEDPAVWQSLGIAHYTLGEMTADAILLEKSVQLFENAASLAKGPMSEILNNWGISLMKLSEVTQDLQLITIAADKFEQAIAFHQNSKRASQLDPEWFYNYGCALDYLGDYYQDPSYYEKAVTILSHILSQYPQYTQARYNLALALTHLGDATGETELIENALHHYEELYKEDPEDEIVLADYGLALMTLGDIYFQSHAFSQGKSYYGEAETKLLQAGSLGAKGAFYWLACLYSLNSNYPECIHFLEKADEHDALPSLEEIENEVWLDGVRSTSSYKAFISKLT